jgi:hypothetical protein
VGAGSSLREIAAEADEELSRLAYVPAVILGHLRLLAGLVRANRPWRLAAKLYGVLAAALAASGYGIVTSDIWRPRPRSAGGGSQPCVWPRSL